MNDEPATAIAAPLPSLGRSSKTGSTNGQGRGGIIARGEQEAASAVEAAIAELGYSPKPVEFRPLPFAGTWGLATSVAFALANEAVTQDLEASGKLEGLSKKEAKGLTSSLVRERVPLVAEQIARLVVESGNPLFAAVEAANGYVKSRLTAAWWPQRWCEKCSSAGAPTGMASQSPNP